MRSGLQTDDMRAAVAIERREALKKPPKENTVGATVVGRRPHAARQGGTLDLKLDGQVPEGSDTLTVTWQKETAAAELISARLSDDGVPIIEVSVSHLTAERARRVSVFPRQEGLFDALDEVLSALDGTSNEFALRLTDPTAPPRRLSLPAVSAADLARAGTTWNPGQHRAS